MIVSGMLGGLVNMVNIKLLDDLRSRKMFAMELVRNNNRPVCGSN